MEKGRDLVGELEDVIFEKLLNDLARYKKFLEVWEKRASEKNNSDLIDATKDLNNLYFSEVSCTRSKLKDLKNSKTYEISVREASEVVDRVEKIVLEYVKNILRDEAADTSLVPNLKRILVYFEKKESLSPDEIKKVKEIFFAKDWVKEMKEVFAKTKTGLQNFNIVKLYFNREKLKTLLAKEGGLLTEGEKDLKKTVLEYISREESNIKEIKASGMLQETLKERIEDLKNLKRLQPDFSSKVIQAVKKWF